VTLVLLKLVAPEKLLSLTMLRHFVCDLVPVLYPESLVKPMDFNNIPPKI